MTDFSIGDYINERYLVLERFSGGMGVAYLVEDLHRPQDATLPLRMIAKTLHPSLDQDSLFDQFLNEAAIWINLSPKQNVVHAYKVESINGIPFVFAEYIRPGVLPNSLAKWIHYRLTPLEVALFFAVQILDGLWYVYQDGVEFHGDLKPSNILIDEDLFIKLNDWGLSRSDKSQTTDEEARWYARYHGSSPYLAPEGLLSSPIISRALDGFAFGIVLGEMLTGLRFAAGTAEATVLENLCKRSPGTSQPVLRALAQIVSQLLSPVANDRVEFYETHARRIADIYSEMTGINVINESDTILIETQPDGHAERVQDSVTTLETLRDFRHRGGGANT